jgi:hypothetical protein
MKKRERLNEELACLCEKIGGKNCQSAKQYRRMNRRIELRRKHTHATQRNQNNEEAI